MLFEDGPPPLVDRPDCLLFPPTNDTPSPRKAAHSKKKPEDHIPRPPNAFILFRSSFIKSQHVSTEVETNHSTLSKIIGLTWKNLPNDERLLWHAKAKEALDEHKRKFPQYAFRPNQTRQKGGAEKRKVREVEPKDHTRCAKIAELLVEGKKGQELDAAIQEFDKHHVPEVVTRFEAPLTARMYCRSSSLPAGGAKDSIRRKSRSASTQPATRVVSNPSSVSLLEMDTESQPADTFASTFDSYPVTPTSPSFVRSLTLLIDSLSYLSFRISTHFLSTVNRHQHLASRRVMSYPNPRALKEICYLTLHTTVVLASLSIRHFVGLMTGIALRPSQTPVCLVLLPLSAVPLQTSTIPTPCNLSKILWRNHSAVIYQPTQTDAILS